MAARSSSSAAGAPDHPAADSKRALTATTACSNRPLRNAGGVQNRPRTRLQAAAPSAAEETQQQRKRRRSNSATAAGDHLLQLEAAGAAHSSAAAAQAPGDTPDSAAALQQLPLLLATMTEATAAEEAAAAADKVCGMAAAAPGLVLQALLSCSPPQEQQHQHQQQTPHLLLVLLEAGHSGIDRVAVAAVQTLVALANGAPDATLAALAQASNLQALLRCLQPAVQPPQQLRLGVCSCVVFLLEAVARTPLGAAAMLPHCGTLLAALRSTVEQQLQEQEQASQQPKPRGKAAASSQSKRVLQALHELHSLQAAMLAVLLSTAVEAPDAQVGWQAIAQHMLPATASAAGTSSNAAGAGMHPAAAIMPALLASADAAVAVRSASLLAGLARSGAAAGAAAVLPVVPALLQCLTAAIGRTSPAAAGPLPQATAAAASNPPAVGTRAVAPPMVDRARAALEKAAVCALRHVVVGGSPGGSGAAAGTAAVVAAGPRGLQGLVAVLLRPQTGDAHPQALQHAGEVVLSLCQCEAGRLAIIASSPALDTLLQVMKRPTCPARPAVAAALALLAASPAGRQALMARPLQLDLLLQLAVANGSDEARLQTGQAPVAAVVAQPQAAARAWSAAALGCDGLEEELQPRVRDYRLECRDFMGMAQPFGEFHRKASR